MARYTPELLVAIRRRYEETDDPMPLMAAEFDVSTRTIYRMAACGRWARRMNRPPRTIPSALRLREEARALRNARTQLKPATWLPPAAGVGSEPPSARRIQQMIDRQFEALEAERKRPDADTPAAGERRAEMLAMMANAMANLYCGQD